MSSLSKKVITLIKNREKKIRQIEIELKELRLHLAFLQGDNKNINKNTGT